MSTSRFEFLGGEQCLDFVNTVHNFGAADPDDELRDFGDLVAWGLEAGLLERPSRGQQKAGSLVEVRKVRGLLYCIFSRVARRQQPQSGDLQALSRWIAEGARHKQLSTGGGEISWTWDHGGNAVRQILWKVLDSSARLLLSADRTRVRQCRGRNCTWLFVDRTKNGTRRWCDMSVCGNREKSRRHYAKIRSRKQKTRKS